MQRRRSWSMGTHMKKIAIAFGIWTPIVWRIILIHICISIYIYWLLKCIHSKTEIIVKFNFHNVGEINGNFIWDESNLNFNYFMLRKWMNLHCKQLCVILLIIERNDICRSLKNIFTFNRNCLQVLTSVSSPILIFKFFYYAQDVFFA